MKRRKVALVIVAYNARRYLDGCLGTLRQARHEQFDLEVIVVDNASRDGTAEEIKRNYPWVELIESGKNLGFAGGNNLGMRSALERGADHVYLLNQDTEVDADFLEEAVKVAEADEKIGSVQSLLLLHPEKDLINSTGNAIHFLGFGYCRNYRRPLGDWRHAGIDKIAYASGAGVLLRASALREIGLFDESLFLYHEDLDLGWRLRLAGCANVLAPHSVVYHKYEFSRSISKYYFMERNRYLVMFKNYRLWTLVVLAPWLLLSEIGLFAASLRSGWWREKLKVYAYFINPLVWLRLARDRAAVCRLRRVGDREIVSLFTPVIAFQGVAGPLTAVANPLMTILWFFLKFLIV